jgi:hypothetical protein
MRHRQSWVTRLYLLDGVVRIDRRTKYVDQRRNRNALKRNNNGETT